MRRNLIKLARPGHGHNSKHAAPWSSLCPEGFDRTPPLCVDGAEVPRIEEIPVVTEIIVICFFSFLSLRTVRIVILYHWLEKTVSVSLYIVYSVKGFT